MGGTLVMLAVDRAFEAQLGNVAFRALVVMAKTALDRENDKGEQPNLYFGGRRLLARGLGFGVADPNEWDSTAARKAVERAVTELMDAGLIFLNERPHTSHEARYDLTPLRRAWTPSQRPPERALMKARRDEKARLRLDRFRAKSTPFNGDHLPVDNPRGPTESTPFNVREHPVQR